MLIQRLATSAITIIAIIVIIFFLPNWVFGLVATVLICLGLYEFYTMIEKKGIFIYKYFGILIGSLIPITIFLDFELTKSWELFFIVCLCLLMFILQFARPDSSEAITGISTTLFGIFYISWLFSFLIKIRFISDSYLADGKLLVSFLIMSTKAGDIGAYLVGTRFGRHILIPRISPKKSIEGFIAALIFCILSAVAWSGFLKGFAFVHILTLGVIFGILGQIGDLSESLVKRDCQVKDSGRLFPGLGGALDIIDSILFTAPIFYFYIKLLL